MDIRSNPRQYPWLVAKLFGTDVHGNVRGNIRGHTYGHVHGTPRLCPRQMAISEATPAAMSAAMSTAISEAMSAVMSAAMSAVMLVAKSAAIAAVVHGNVRGNTRGCPWQCTRFSAAIFEGCTLLYIFADSRGISVASRGVPRLSTVNAADIRGDPRRRPPLAENCRGYPRIVLCPWLAASLFSTDAPAMSEATSATAPTAMP